MASSHARSNSFPSRSHPIVRDVEDHLQRLEASQLDGTTSTTSSICADLASLRNLHDGINNLIQTLSAQQALIASVRGENRLNELLESSLRLVDLCSFLRDVVQLTKASIRELESSVRRQADGLDAYLASRKKVSKMVDKRMKNLIKPSSQRATAAGPCIGKMLQDAETINLSVLKSVMMMLVNKRSRPSLLSKIRQRSSHADYSEDEESGRSGDLCLTLCNIRRSQRSMDGKTMLSRLKACEMSMHEIEEHLEALFRSYVKTRVLLLNVHSH